MKSLKSVIKGTGRFIINNFVVKPIHTISLLTPNKWERYVNGQGGYFPEMQRHSRASIFIRQLNHIWRYGSPNKFFFLFGLDVKNFHNEENYIDYNYFAVKRNKLNKLGHKDSSVGVLRNKLLFSLLARQLSIPHPKVIGTIENENIHLFDNNEIITLENYLLENSGNVFIKKLTGECADGVYNLIFQNGNLILNSDKITLEDFKKKIKGGKFLVQETINNQIQELNNIYSESINTIRLTTIIDPKTREVKILPPTLRVGANGSKVDNWAAGGLIIGIDQSNSRLHKYGFYKPSYWKHGKGKETHHPDSGVKFEGYYIPLLKEAIEITSRIHYFLNDIHSIGWDIALTEEGVQIIEGNDNWEITLPQACDHGLKKEFMELFR